MRCNLCVFAEGIQRFGLTCSEVSAGFMVLVQGEAGEEEEEEEGEEEERAAITAASQISVHGKDQGRRFCSLIRAVPL